MENMELEIYIFCVQEGGKEKLFGTNNGTNNDTMAANLKSEAKMKSNNMPANCGQSSLSVQRRSHPMSPRLRRWCRGRGPILSNSQRAKSHQEGRATRVSCDLNSHRSLLSPPRNTSVLLMLAHSHNPLHPRVEYTIVSRQSKKLRIVMI